MLVASGDRAPLEHSLVGRRLIHRIDLYTGKYGNSNLFYDNKRVHISPLFCTLIFFPRTLVGGGGGGTMCSNCQNFHNCSVFKYSGVLFLGIPAFCV